MHQKNRYIVNKIPFNEWLRQISIADVRHCENPLQVEDDWIEEYNLETGDFDIKNVDKD